MNDLISRSALKDDLVDSKEKLSEIYRRITHEVGKQICAGQIGTFQEVILRVKDAPAVDAVAVVRCKDCAWCKKPFPEHFPQMLECMRYDMEVAADEFCSRSERRDDE